MKTKGLRLSNVFIVLFLYLFLAACGDNSSHTEHKHITPDVIQAGEECHLCGMAITQFPGPKGQLFSKHSTHIKKFCSTNDLLAYALQPENKDNIKKIFVHDMSKAHWNSPQDAPMIDAQSAWYVKGHDLHGAMGPTLASFSSEKTAIAFANINKGEVIKYHDITLELLAGLAHHH